MASEKQDYAAKLLDWNVLRSPDLDRHPYSVADVAVYPFKFENSEKCEVIPEVLTASYNKSVILAAPRCQQFYYLGTQERGSVVCATCMRGARYTLFSVYESAYVNLMHSHTIFLARCFYCLCKINSISIKKCECNKNVEELIRFAPMYRCIRI